MPAATRGIRSTARRLYGSAGHGVGGIRRAGRPRRRRFHRNLRAFITNLAEERNQLLQAGEEKARFDIYPVEVDFDQLPDTTDADRAARDALKSIPTSWTLSAEDGAKLDRAAGELLWRHPCFRDLIRDLRATGTPEAPAVPGAACTAPPPIQAPIQPPGKAK